MPTSLLPTGAPVPAAWSRRAGAGPLDDLRASASLAAARGGVPALLALLWDDHDDDARRARPAPVAPASVLADGRQLAARADLVWRALASDQRDDDLSVVISVLHAAGFAVLADELADQRAGALRVPHPRRAAVPGSAPLGMTSHLLAMGRGHHLRVVSWHNTPPSRRDQLRAELAALQQRYRLWTLADLEAVTATGTWPDDPRPGLLPVFYEGYRASAEVAAPVCDELGITGWFGVCTGFVSCRPDQQELFARSHKVVLLPEDLAAPSAAMTWDQVGELAQRHVVFAHTASHAGIEETPTDADLEREVLAPATALRAATGQDAGVFAWLHGSPTGTSARHDAALRAAGYRHLVSATAVHRL
ncbi:polysaccharide deacetylase family protein [Streptomyces sp. NP160]|uniref:polysaccharide deacetylase family protein n=1 Tax=Streptomyces sp. NP160 TaxID=2586637 RepID=UPI001C5797F7|nr:polysaccharide deacetylase family protein [Streptomyces sp. NP160]